MITSTLLTGFHRKSIVNRWHGSARVLYTDEDASQKKSADFDPAI